MDQITKKETIAGIILGFYYEDDNERPSEELCHEIAEEIMGRFKVGVEK